MDPTVLFISVALAMDCLTVSVTEGMVRMKPKVDDALKIAASFGSFQSLMTLLGWFAGSNFVEIISGLDHWVAFILLASVGIRMVFASIKLEKRLPALDLWSILMLSLATSIDALAVGLCFIIINESLISSAVVIGIVSFILSIIGFYAGKYFGRIVDKKAEAVGGLVLVAIGLKILVEHL